MEKNTIRIHLISFEYVSVFEFFKKYFKNWKTKISFFRTLKNSKNIKTIKTETYIPLYSFLDGFYIFWVFNVRKNDILVFQFLKYFLKNSKTETYSNEMCSNGICFPNFEFFWLNCWDETIFFCLQKSGLVFSEYLILLTRVGLLTYQIVTLKNERDKVC